MSSALKCSKHIYPLYLLFNLFFVYNTCLLFVPFCKQCRSWWSEACIYWLLRPHSDWSKCQLLDYKSNFHAFVLWLIGTNTFGNMSIHATNGTGKWKATHTERRQIIYILYKSKDFLLIWIICTDVMLLVILVFKNLGLDYCILTVKSLLHRYWLPIQL